MGADANVVEHRQRSETARVLKVRHDADCASRSRPAQDACLQRRNSSSPWPNELTEAMRPELRRRERVETASARIALVIRTQGIRTHSTR